MDDLSASRMRILIVEDDRVTSRSVEATLLRRGFEVAGAASTAAEARDLAASKSPDLVLMDIELGEGDDGIDLAAELRERHGLPVVFLTGFSGDSLFERARRSRPAGFIRKPFSDAELAVCLEAVAERNATRTLLERRLPGVESLAQHLPQAVIFSDLGGAVQHLNPAGETLTGWTAAEAAGSPLSEVAPLSAFEEPPARGRDAPLQSPLARRAVLRTRSGESKRVEERGAPVKSEDGEVVGLITVLVEASAPPPRQLPHAAADTAAADDPSGSESGPDDGAPGALPHPPGRKAALAKIAALAGDPGFRKLIAKPGGTPPAPEQASALAAADAAAPVPIETPSLIDDVADPLVKIDADGTVCYANAEAAAVFAGESPLGGRPLWDLFDEETARISRGDFERPLVEGRRHRFEFHDAARGRWYEVRAYPAGGGVLALFHDATAERLEHSDQVRQQRLEGLGLLARGFAHDFNNHLTSLTGNISLARERHEDDAELQNLLGEALAAAARATGLVQQLMTFARGGRPIRERTRIPDLVRRVLTDHRLRHPEIRYQFQNADSELLAYVDPAQIGRLIENLVDNSAAAMPGGGVLIVRCERIRPERVLDIKGSHTPADEEHFLVEVIDTGVGMSGEALERVFEPYFTTRKDDNATGIGLTVCESIARAHGGFVQLQSKEGKGTIANFCAPLGMRAEAMEAPVSVPPAPRPAAAERPSGEEMLLLGTRILILEDDAPIRRLMAATLRRAGHEVVETKDGSETVEIYRDALEQGARFHLLICDLTIENGVGGVETMRRLLEIDPEILAIVSSGYSDAPAMSSPDSFGFKGVLPKPYAPSELRAAVHRILSAHHVIP